MDDKNLLDGQSVAKVAADPRPTRAGSVHISDTNAAGRIVLDDAGRANVPSITDIGAIANALQTWGQAPVTYCVVVASEVPGVFCAGLHPSGLDGAAPDSAQALVAEAYKLTWTLDCFIKPFIALIDGVVSGAGAGLSLYGTHRVAGESFRFSMPGPAQGWFPDHGTARVLTALPHEIGMYLALTGHDLGRNDAFDLGLLTQRIDAQHYPAITAALSDADPVDPLLDALDRDGTRELAPWKKDTIARCFAADNVESILARLDGEAGDARAWARAAAEDISRCSPLALKITHRLLREARGLDLRATLRLDYRIASRLLAEPGATSATRPATLADVDAAMVDRYFAPLAGGDLALAPRVDLEIAEP